MTVRRCVLFVLLVGCGNLPSKPVPAAAPSAEKRPYFFAPEEDNGMERVDPSLQTFQRPSIHLVELPDSGAKSL